MKTKPLALLFAALLLILALAHSNPLIEMRDTAGYKTIANSVLAQFSEHAPEPLSFSIRMPLFSIFLAFAEILPLTFAPAVLFLHGIIGLIALYALANALSPFISIYYSSLLILTYFIFLREYYFTASTEWIAICLLLMQIALFLKLLRSAKPKDLFICGLVSSIGLLLRPSFLVAYLFLFVASILCLRKKTCSTNKILLLTISSNFLIFIWLLFNFLKLGTLALFPFSGMSAFGLASVLGEAHVLESDPPKLKTFIEEVNRTKHTSSRDYARENYFFVDQLKKFQHHNTWKVGFKLSERLKLNLATQNEYMGIYAKRALKNERKRHFYYFLHSLFYYTHSIFYLAIFIFAFYLSWTREHLRPLFFTLSISLLFHYLHVALCSLVEMPNMRYFSISYYLPLLISGIIVFASARRLPGVLSAGTFQKEQGS